MTHRMLILAPAILFRGRVNAPGGVTYPILEIPYDGVTVGSFNVAAPGTTLLLGSAAGLDDYGRQRIRRLGTSTVLRVGRSSQGAHDGELNVVDNAHITVLYDYRVWAKIPFIDTDGDIFKDGEIQQASNALDPPPKANGGSGVAGTINSGTGLLTVAFNGANSFQFDPAVSSALSGVATYSWIVSPGTIISGTSTSAAITVTFPAGFHWVHLLVTSGALKDHTLHIPVYARDPDNDLSISEFQIVSRHLTQYTQEISVKILADIPQSTYPDGTLVMIWDREPFSTSDRTNMQFIGWHQADDGQIQGQRTGTLRDTVWHLVDVAGRLMRLPGFPQFLEAVVSVNKWTQTRYPNIFYYLHYLLVWHSTALDVADLLLGTQTLNNFAFKVLESDEDNLHAQIEKIASRVTPDHHFTCNRQGQLLLVGDPMLFATSPTSIRNNVGVLDIISDGDWVNIEFSYERSPRVYQMLTYAILNSSAVVTAIASLAPGTGQGQGTQYIETSERIAFSQFDLNYVEGHRYARMNAHFGRFTITVPYQMLVATFEPANMQWIRLDVDSDVWTQRGLPFSSARGIVTEMDIQYEYSRTGVVITASLQWEMETSGPPAQTVDLI